MNQKKWVTRFPPSPTGFLHIGGARTALFNWLFSRHHGGKFILRIEDTDKQRSTEEATHAILESLEWLGLDWDDGPYFQSRRYDLYNTFVDRLVSKGKAYYCHCSQEALEQRKKAFMAKGLKPKYDGRCRDLGLGPAPNAVVRLKNPQTGITRFHDLIKGPIQFNNEELDDLILKRSDGSPTYHLAVVADDIDLKITHVIRGDDHVNNTPRQILIYEALDIPVPEYAHVPMILGPDGKRLSKRHGALSVLAYRDMGYLPHALTNALARLGWSHGDQERFTMEELVEKFTLDHVGKSSGIFNTEKLLDLNAWSIRETADARLAEELIPYLEASGFKDIHEEKLRQVVNTLKARSKTLVDMAEAARFYFEEETVYEEKADRKFLKPEIRQLLELLKKAFEETASFDQTSLEKVMSDFLDKNEISLKKIAQPIRVALTGKTASPGLFEVMEVLGQETVIKRIDRAIRHIKGKP